VGVAVVEAGHDAAALQVDAAGLRSGQRLHVGRVSHGDEHTPSNRDGLGLRLRPVQRRDAAVHEDGVGKGRHGDSTRQRIVDALWSGSVGAGFAHAAQVSLAKGGEAIGTRSTRDMADIKTSVMAASSCQRRPRIQASLRSGPDWRCSTDGAR
jgi:hypothetical protein